MEIHRNQASFERFLAVSFALSLDLAFDEPGVCSKTSSPSKTIAAKRSALNFSRVSCEIKHEHFKARKPAKSLPKLAEKP